MRIGYGASPAIGELQPHGSIAPNPAVRKVGIEQHNATRSGHPPVSLDDLVGELQDRLRHGQAERLSGVEIDDQLEGGRLLDR